MDLLSFLLGAIIAFGICGMSDSKAIDIGKIKLKGKWYKLVKLEEDQL